MTVFDFIYATLVLVAIVILGIGWIGTKYDIVGRDVEIKKLQLEIKKMEEKDVRRKRRSKQKKKVFLSKGINREDDLNAKTISQ